MTGDLLQTVSRVLGFLANILDYRAYPTLAFAFLNIPIVSFLDFTLDYLSPYSSLTSSTPPFSLIERSGAHHSVDHNIGFDFAQKSCKVRRWINTVCKAESEKQGYAAKEQSQRLVGEKVRGWIGRWRAVLGWGALGRGQVCLGTGGRWRYRGRG